MAVFSPKATNEIMAEMIAQIVARTSITSGKPGRVITDICYALADQIYQAYTEAEKALALLKLDHTTGSDLDLKAAEYKNMAPRIAATKASGQVTVSDPAITKVETTVATGGAESGDTTLNVVDTTDFTDTGTALIGTRGEDNWEEFYYTSKTATTLVSSTDSLDFDHGTDEPVVLSTGGDRIYTGPFTVSTVAKGSSQRKKYQTVLEFTLYDGEEGVVVDITAEEYGQVGNTAAGTITEFIGATPFPASDVTNLMAISNGLNKESDRELRERIRREMQAQSSANIDAVTSALLGINYNGQVVQFLQHIDDPNPTLPSKIYIDDGSGYTPTQATVTNHVLQESSPGGNDDLFYLPMAYCPIVVGPGEDTSRVYANISLKLNDVTINQGDGAGQYRVNPYSGLIKLNESLAAGDRLVVASVTHYDALISLANKTLYGDQYDRSTYPGVTALSVWIKLLTPVTSYMSVQASLVLDGSRPLTDVISDIKNRHLSYVNNLGIGATVVKNRLQALGFIKGVKDFTVQVPTSDIEGTTGTLIRLQSNNIVIA